MRVCLTVDFYPPHIGGSETYVSQVAEGLAREGVTCVVVTLRTDYEAPEIEERPNLRIVRIGSPRSGRLYFTLLGVPRIVREARNCDLIHGSSYGAAIPAFIAAKVLRKKCIFTAYEFMGAMWKHLEPNPVKSTLYRVIEKLIALLPFDRFVAISRYTRNILRIFGVADAKLDIIYGGRTLDAIDNGCTSSVMRTRLGLEANGFVYLAYGRAGITKGIEYFVEAIPKILKAIPDARFVLILTKSDAVIWARIELALKLLPRDVCRLIPGLPYGNLIEHLLAADCIVVPSLSEGFGLAILEACTLNKIVVASDVGSIPEVIFGRHVLTRPRSSKALAEACLRAHRGETDYLPPKTFVWSETVLQFRRIYAELLDVRSGRA